MSERLAIDNDELQKYLKAAISLETDVATQQNLIQCYNTSSYEREPQLRQDNHPVAPQKPTHIHYGFSFNDSKAIFPSILFLLGVFMFLFGMYGASVNNTGDNAGFATMGWVSLLGVIPHIAMHIVTAKKNKDMDQQYEEQMAKYQAACASIDQNNAQYNATYNRDHAAWESNNRSNLNIMRGKLSETNRVLSALYQKGYIYEKYHNLPALTSIAEYFLTGRCDTLTGPHGAYNMYEDEVRKDTVISQLNVVIENLEKIKQNQYMLYQQVKAIQEQTYRMGNQLESIKTYTANIMDLTAINAYYAALTARNTEISAAYHILNG